MKRLLLFLWIVSLICLLSCDDSTAPVDVIDDSDIPADPTNVAVPPTTFNNIRVTSSIAKNTKSRNRVEMNVTGIINPFTFEPIQLIPQVNLFITEDKIVKGTKVTKISNQSILKVDLVFTIDHSESMGQESDSIATGIIKFSKFLNSVGADVRFGIVGYDKGVGGAINFTDAKSIEMYLNRNSVTGALRSIGFEGPDRAYLKSEAKNFAEGLIGENGVVGVLFADSNFSWRSSAQRIFINFTDEPTQSNGIIWNTNYMCMKIGGRASVHTIFSKDSTAYKWDEKNERPWDMSICTGGSFLFIDDSAVNLNLLELPVSDMIANSYLVEFLSSNGNAAHTVEITVKESTADGKRVYTSITY